MIAIRFSQFVVGAMALSAFAPEQSSPPFLAPSGSTVILGQAGGETYEIFDLQCPGGGAAIPFGINNREQVVGSCESSDSSFLDGFFFKNRVFMNFAYPAALQTVPQGINDKGDIVGYYNLPGEGVQHGFLYDGTSFTPLDYPGSFSTTLYGIDNRGQIVGNYGSPAPPTNRMLLYRAGTFTTLGTCPLGQPVSWAQAINNKTQIVGGYLTLSGYDDAFLYENGRFAAIHFPNALEVMARAINNSGRIAGWYRDSTGLLRYHGFLYRKGNYTTWDHPNAGPGTFLTGQNDEGGLVGYYYATTGTVTGFWAKPKNQDCHER